MTDECLFLITENNSFDYNLIWILICWKLGLSFNPIEGLAHNFSEEILHCLVFSLLVQIRTLVIVFGRG